MRWKNAWVCALSLIGALGCPHAFGRGGTIEKAMHKDLMERVKNGRCTKEERDIYCAEGEDLEECLNRCG